MPSYSLKSPAKARNRHKRVRGEVIIVAKSKDYFREILDIGIPKPSKRGTSPNGRKKKKLGGRGESTGADLLAACATRDRETGFHAAGVSRHERPDL